MKQARRGSLSDDINIRSNFPRVNISTFARRRSTSCPKEMSSDDQAARDAVNSGFAFSNDESSYSTLAGQPTITQSFQLQPPPPPSQQQEQQVSSVYGYEGGLSPQSYQTTGSSIAVSEASPPEHANLAFDSLQVPSLDDKFASSISLSRQVSTSSFASSPAPSTNFDQRSERSSPNGTTKPSKAKSHSRKRPEGHVKRPPNAFILFRSKVHREGLIPKTLEIRDHRDVSRIVAHMWNNLSDFERQEWEKQAHRIKVEHQQRFPNYKFKPDAPVKQQRAKRNLKQQENTEERCQLIADGIMKMHGRDGVHAGIAARSASIPTRPRNRKVNSNQSRPGTAKQIDSFKSNSLPGNQAANFTSNVESFESSSVAIPLLEQPGIIAASRRRSASMPLPISQLEQVLDSSAEELSIPGEYDTMGQFNSLEGSFLEWQRKDAQAAGSSAATNLFNNPFSTPQPRHEGFDFEVQRPSTMPVTRHISFQNFLEQPSLSRKRPEPLQFAQSNIGNRDSLLSPRSQSMILSQIDLNQDISPTANATNSTMFSQMSSFGVIYSSRRSSQWEMDWQQKYASRQSRLSEADIALPILNSRRSQGNNDFLGLPQTPITARLADHTNYLSARRSTIMSTTPLTASTIGNSSTDTSQTLMQAENILAQTPITPNSSLQSQAVLTGQDARFNDISSAPEFIDFVNEQNKGKSNDEDK